MSEPPLPSWSFHQVLASLLSGACRTHRSVFTSHLVVLQGNLFEDLRMRLEDPEHDDVTWEHPFLTKSVEIPMVWRITDEHLDSNGAERAIVANDGSHPEFTALQVLNGGRMFLKEGDDQRALIAYPYMDLVAKLPADLESQFYKEWGSPVTYGDPDGEPGVVGHSSGESSFRAWRSFTIKPIMIEEDGSKATCSLVAGLRCEGTESPATWTHGERDALWRALCQSHEVLLRHSLSLEPCPERVTVRPPRGNREGYQSFEVVTRRPSRNWSYVTELRPGPIQATPLRFLLQNQPEQVSGASELDHADGPILPITDGTGTLVSFAEFELLATMCFPDDEQNRNEWLANWQGTLLTTISQPIPPHLGRMVCEGPSSKELLSRFEKAFEDGMVAGHILNVALNCAERQPQDTSVRKARDLAEGALVGERDEFGKAMNRSKSTIKALWSRFKPVAHLWAATVLWFHHFPDDLKPSSGSPWETEENLVTFLSVAEELRRRAASTYARGTRKSPEPLLAPSKSWRPPPDLELDTYQMETPPLTDWVQQKLSEYSAK